MLNPELFSVEFSGKPQGFLKQGGLFSFHRFGKTRNAHDTQQLKFSPEDLESNSGGYMKVFNYFTILLILCVGLTSAQTGNSSKSSSRTSKSVGLEVSTTVEAALSGTIDSKNAKVGDEVVLKTTKSIKQFGEVVVPKGSKLIGRITEVTKKGRNSGGSRLGILFDRLEGNDLYTPITASIMSITDVRAASSLDGVAESDIMGSSSTSSRASTSAGGGLLGGVGGTVGGVVNTTTQVAGSAVGTAGQTVGTTTGIVGQSVNGLQISQSASGSASGSTILSTRDKNVRLEKGIMFNLMVTKTGQN